MNLSELLINLHINILYFLRLIAKKNHLSIQQVLCVYSIPIDGITQTNLANSLAIDVSTLSRNLDKLLLLNIIYKRSVPEDERFVKIFLTSYGKTIFKHIIHDLNVYCKHMNLNHNNLDNQSIVDSLSQLNWNLLTNKIKDEY
ncbi:MAG: hypothetical protein CMG66_01620 [Candidatus Marinimicrobia bacterium]|nr:hypothetical protein [Candidatus Neomarinimicrobiota bacterium]|tara:strand:+ start:33720 stop:34148 length:429 start_codon:yes stop_codon:yes gene_type:complete